MTIVMIIKKGRTKNIKKYMRNGELIFINIMKKLMLDFN